MPPDWPTDQWLVILIAVLVAILIVATLVG